MITPVLNELAPQGHFHLITNGVLLALRWIKMLPRHRGQCAFDCFVYQYDRFLLIPAKLRYEHSFQFVVSTIVEPLFNFFTYRTVYGLNRLSPTLSGHSEPP